MKCVGIFLVLSFVVVAVNCDSEGEGEVHRVTGKFVTRTHRIPGGVREIRGEGGEGGRREIRGGRGEGGRRVHRVTGAEQRRVHRVTGQLVTNEHRFRESADLTPLTPKEPTAPVVGSIPISSTGGPAGRRTTPGPLPGPQGGKISLSKEKGRTGGEKNCRKSGLTALADSLNVGLQDLVNGIANVGGAANNGGKPGLLGHILGGAQTTLDNTLGGLDQGVSDFFCGFNRVFNKIGSQLGKGNLLDGVLSGANVFLTGAGSFFGNLGTNAIGAVTSGVSDLIHGRRNKKPNEIVHSHHNN